ncbi:hypothetical protein DBR32_05505 [Taibaiella sp. KBW10]|uniref:hypothetical protein n=1 Tax=Taibaiella sp. KBW10 TaxID=2153357 RepID=UPI000F5A1F78|nr:hypothetical protein [Taibaiella sp. KBW10]RQO31419.1 hypothetical protein DBR32_05505 [Taibaiella sp. KBW10]
MRFLIIMTITALASVLLLHFLPWWVCMVIGFLLVLMMPLRMGAATLATGLGTGLCWLVVIVFRDFSNEHILSRQIVVLMGVPSYIFVILIGAVIGFITGGLGGFTASALLNVLRPRKKTPAAL